MWVVVIWWFRGFLGFRGRFEVEGGVVDVGVGVRLECIGVVFIVVIEGGGAFGVYSVCYEVIFITC